MADVQCENGFTKIANEIMEAIAQTRISGEARQIIDVVIRKTYGFQKIEDGISLSQFCLATGLKKPTCCRAIKKAINMNIIIKKDNGNISSYKFNKDFDTWKPLSKKITIIKKDNKSLSKKIPTKYIYTKETSCPDSKRLSGLLASLILKNNPSNRKLNGERDATVLLWAKEISKMMRIDKRPIEEIERVIRWCQADSFWQTNIMCGSKLRKQYDQLMMKSKGKGDNNDGWQYE